MYIISKKKFLRSGGLEPPTFGTGIRRAANCAMTSTHSNFPRPGIEPGSPG